MPSYVEGLVYDEQGKVKPSLKFIIVELTVQNICAEEERNLTSFSFQCADSAEEISGDVTEMNFVDLPIPAYFSHPGEGTEYYHNWLPVGESETFKVGWYVDTEQYDMSQLYLVFNRYNEEYTKYVKLEF